MILNKKGLAVLPLAALLFTSCNKGPSYEQAKKFIDENYKTEEPAPLYPTKVHEKFTARGNTVDSVTILLMLPVMEHFYDGFEMMNKLKFTDVAPYTCEYEGDYIPSEQSPFDSPILPIISDEVLSARDCLIKSSNEDGTSINATYEIKEKEKQFKQNLKRSTQSVKDNTSILYNNKGYRIEVTANGNAKGKLTIEYEGKSQEFDLDYTYEFSATYTYAE